MGTHPIFESDFDCLTDGLKRFHSKMSAELACTYAALILSDDGVDISGDKIASLLKAANVEVEPFWPGLFAGALKNCYVSELISSISAGVGAGPAAGGGAEEAKEEEKKPESSSESDDDMGFDMFG